MRMVFGDAGQDSESRRCDAEQAQSSQERFPSFVAQYMIYMKSFHMSKSRVRRYVVGNLCILNSFSTDSLRQWKR